MSNRRKRLKQEKLLGKKMNHNKSIGQRADLGEDGFSGGAITVTGPLEVVESERAIREHRSEEERANAYKESTRTNERALIRVSWFTAVVSCLYLLVTVGIFCITKNSLDLSRQYFEATSRPYLGIEKISVVHLHQDPKTHQPVNERHQIPGVTDALGFTVTVENGGSVSGTNARISWRVFCGAEEIPQAGYPAQAATITPRREVSLMGAIQGDRYFDVLARKKLLTMSVYIQYDGPMQQYRDCERMQYEPFHDGFANLGSCRYDPPKSPPVEPPG